jgi:hypothetical protein
VSKTKKAEKSPQEKAAATRKRHEREGLEPGSDARVYRDGEPGEGVLMCTMRVPQDARLEVRNLAPGTYVVVDELGNREDFAVDSMAESAWVPVKGVK